MVGKRIICGKIGGKDQKNVFSLQYMQECVTEGMYQYKAETQKHDDQA